MAENTPIPWCTHTWNPWRGCTKIAPECAHCYAATLSHRNPGTLGVWGPNGTRVVASSAYWSLPLHWDRKAQQAGVRPRVFCASLADVFEDWPGPMHDPSGNILNYNSVATWWTSEPNCRPIRMDFVRERIASTIQATPNLDWLLLTKRPENINRMGAEMFGRDVKVHGFPPNVWLGTSVGHHESLWRVAQLMETNAAVRFLSCEPLLENLMEVRRGLGNLALFLHDDRRKPCEVEVYPFVGMKAIPDCDWNSGPIHWVILGGESGAKARPCQLDWLRAIVAKCRASETPVFVKQLGSLCYEADPDGPALLSGLRRFRTKDKKGEDINEFPDDLKVREFPTPRAMEARSC